MESYTDADANVTFALSDERLARLTNRHEQRTLWQMLRYGRRGPPKGEASTGEASKGEASKVEVSAAAA